MTPITPSTGAGLPYDTISGGQVVDSSAQPYGGAASHAELYDAALAGQQAAPLTTYDAAAAYHAAYEDPYGSAASPVAGMQPAIAAAPTATMDDFAALGIFTDAELQQLYEMQLPPHEMGILFEEAVAYMRSAEFARSQSAATVDEPVVDEVADEPAVDEPAPVDATPGWNADWETRFRDALTEQGLASKTRLLVVESFERLGLTEQELQQALEYYTTHPDGLAELQAVDEQVRAGETKQAHMLLISGAMAATAVGATTALAASRGNLTRVLTRTAASGADDAARTLAARALGALDDGTLVRGSSLADDAARMLRSEAAATNRLLHPFRKVTTNAAARHLTAPARLSRADIARYGLWMKAGDTATDAARSAGTAAGAARTAGTIAGGADDVARGAAQAARGAGVLSKAGRVLGPVGIALSAGLGAWGIKQTMEAEGGFGEESAKMTGNVAGGLGGGIAGAAAGAAIGSVVPVIGTGIGAVVGGVVGGLGGGVIGEHVGGFLHGLFG